MSRHHEWSSIQGFFVSLIFALRGLEFGNLPNYRGKNLPPESEMEIFVLRNINSAQLVFNLNLTQFFISGYSCPVRQVLHGSTQHN